MSQTAITLEELRELVYRDLGNCDILTEFSMVLLDRDTDNMTWFRVL